LRQRQLVSAGRAAPEVHELTHVHGRGVPAGRRHRSRLRGYAGQLTRRQRSRERSGGTPFPIRFTGLDEHLSQHGGRLTQVWARSDTEPVSRSGGSTTRTVEASQPPRAPLDGRGVHEHALPRCDDDARVVEAPATVGAGGRRRRVRDLLQPRSAVRLQWYW
jgi:hypothetical protein